MEPGLLYEFDVPQPWAAERCGYPSPPDLIARRQDLAKAVAAGTWRTEPAAHEEMLSGVRTLVFRSTCTPRAAVLHLHGGGFRLGCPEMIGPFAAALAARCGVDVFCPAYRLAPEHPMPAALADAHRVAAALRQHNARPLIFSGDSAGGGLAASLTALGMAEGSSPAGLMLLSPWLDLTLSSECYDTNAATDHYFSRAAAAEAAELYLQGMAARNPLASPLLGELGGFPPTFISIGKGEVLADDARRFHSALCAVGVTATLMEIANMEHVAVTRGLTQIGAAETFNAMAEFIDRLLHSSTGV
jgi:monoterpene epsilon-lactone hydrolase